MPSPRNSYPGSMKQGAEAAAAPGETHRFSTLRYSLVNMPLPGPPAEKDPPPPIIMFRTAKGMKSSSWVGGGGEGAAQRRLLREDRPAGQPASQGFWGGCLPETNSSPGQS